MRLSGGDESHTEKTLTDTEIYNTETYRDILTSTDTDTDRPRYTAHIDPDRQSYITQRHTNVQTLTHT